ncbi:MAG TPA: hypothetical protein VLQ45_31645, partial [Thermoanaerobaculia bacterium]|nr:hypothetical protein [Thermoanaerobaculia bacterium]
MKLENIASSSQGFHERECFLKGARCAVKISALPVRLGDELSRGISAFLIEPEPQGFFESLSRFLDSPPRSLQRAEARFFPREPCLNQREL